MGNDVFDECLFFSISFYNVGSLWRINCFFQFSCCLSWSFKGNFIIFCVGGYWTGFFLIKSFLNLISFKCFIFKTVTDFGPLTCSIVTTLRKVWKKVRLFYSLWVPLFFKVCLVSLEFFWGWFTCCLTFS